MGPYEAMRRFHEAEMQADVTRSVFIVAAEWQDCKVNCHCQENGKRCFVAERTEQTGETPIIENGGIVGWLHPTL